MLMLWLRATWRGWRKAWRRRIRMRWLVSKRVRSPAWGSVFHDSYDWSSRDGAPIFIQPSITTTLAISYNPSDLLNTACDPYEHQRLQNAYANMADQQRQSDLLNMLAQNSSLPPA